MWLVVGLGNPGPKYARNRHNVGFRAVEVLASRHGLGELRSGGKLGGATATGVLTTPRGRVKVVLLEPMEFMNLSGFAVRRAATFYGVDLDHTVVLHDEIDLDFGVLRVKTGGGHGGHNGLRSIIEQCGGNGFARIRIGVGIGQLDFQQHRTVRRHITHHVDPRVPVAAEMPGKRRTSSL